MSNTKWFIISIVQTLTPTGYIIVITTDVPCHLWMRWTIIEPKEHLVPVIRRGVAFRSDKYFCFDVYEDNEQEEAGDTLIHTFIKEPWPVCETRYFYFHGEIAGVASKSTTTIFKKHRVPPPITTDFYPEPGISVDGRVDERIGAPNSGLGVPWATLIAGAGTGKNAVLAHSTFIYMECGSNEDEYHYLIRGIFLFDTSSLPYNAQIISATLSLYGVVKIDEGDWLPDVNVYSADPASMIALANGDFDSLGSTPFCDTPIAYGDWITTGYNDFPLNAAGLAAISKYGITKLGLRNANYDVAGVAPAWQGTAEQDRYAFTCYMSEQGNGFKPKLTITYTLA